VLVVQPTLIILLNGVGDVSGVMKRNGHLIWREHNGYK
jgi:hypothetical protein